MTAEKEDREFQCSLFTLRMVRNAKGGWGQQGVGGTCREVWSKSWMEKRKKKKKKPFWCINFLLHFLLNAELAGFSLKSTSGFPTSTKPRIRLAESHRDTNSQLGRRTGQERSRWWGHPHGWRCVSCRGQRRCPDVLVPAKSVPALPSPPSPRQEEEMRRC